MMELTAELRRWKLAKTPQGYYYWGDIYGDSKKRWEDGTRIHTSQVMSKVRYDSCTHVKTRNSLYVLKDDEELGNTNWQAYAVTDPIHGGKVICELCGGFVDSRLRYKKIGDRIQHLEQECNPYLNYYGPGKPID